VAGRAARHKARRRRGTEGLSRYGPGGTAFVLLR
jgi:hypothetical protein